MSIPFDDQTTLLLDRLYSETQLPASAEAYVQVPPDDPPDDADGSLTQTERAFQWSLNYQNKLHGSRQSIKVKWHEEIPRAAGRR